MSPITVFIRVLLRSSAIFLGVATIFLHPQLEWRPGSYTGVVAQQESREAALDGLMAALLDSDAAVRRDAAYALGRLGNPRAAGALVHAVNDQDPDVRREALRALRQLGGARPVR